MLSPERRVNSRSRLDSISFADVQPEVSGAIYRELKSAFGDTQITRKTETKHRVAQVENPRGSSDIPSFNMHLDPLIYLSKNAFCKIAEVQADNPGHSIQVIVETVRYHDKYSRWELLPHMYALCEPLSSESQNPQFRIPPFYALYDRKEAFCFEILYNFPQEHAMHRLLPNPVTLHELLMKREERNYPSWESRFRLGMELTNSLVAFHDVNWFHKDLTSFSILFFPTDHTVPAARPRNPYLSSFQHSRSASDKFTEGPLQDQKHQRYHHPQYVSVEQRQFLRFRPEFDYYSLGVLLLEIGLWATIDTIMQDFRDLNNFSFSKAMIDQKLPNLSFQMGEICQNCQRLSYWVW